MGDEQGALSEYMLQSKGTHARAREEDAGGESEVVVVCAVSMMLS